ncbi:resistance to inhibitors of cholinesterase protein 3-like isoform X2 [Limulus polyphemus]|uniref:Resistance to inhibitors of cholinesterase protein 3-like isoform X2 n=1 Tax=Limulus polyphemus TaxID=6850 RepID=A0ABM1S975_LIMPO|nr:resistance to inhibitors of cholinesterase protein 3-like isoform X2 [Limulus polyphemus]
MANSSELSTGKSVFVLAVVIGCFAVLWPKIFYPMMQTAFSITMTTYDNDEESFGENSHSHIDPEILPARVRAAMGESRPGSRPQIHEGRPLMHPAAKQGPKVQPKSGGAMGIIMPIYTLLIVVFFLYTIFKFVFKKPADEETLRQPLIKDFHMDHEHRKYILAKEYDEEKKKGAKSKNVENKTKKMLQEYGKTKVEEELAEKNYEISQLRKRLEETEAAMEKIMKHMGVVTEHLAVGMAYLPNSTASTSSQREPVSHNEDLENTDDQKIVPTSINDSSAQKMKIHLSEPDREEESQTSSPDVDNYELVSGTVSIPPTPTSNCTVHVDRESCESSSFEVIGQVSENNGNLLKDYTPTDSEDSVSKELEYFELDTEQANEPKDDCLKVLSMTPGAQEFPETLLTSRGNRNFPNISALERAAKIRRENLNVGSIEEESNNLASLLDNSKSDSEQ